MPEIKLPFLGSPMRGLTVVSRDGDDGECWAGSINSPFKGLREREKNFYSGKQISLLNFI
jgi:hypothetical protein